MLPTLQRQLDQLKMRIRRRRNNHHTNPRILHHLLGRPVGLDTRVVLFSIVVGLGGTLDDGVELELGDFADEGDVEGFGAEAVAYDADVEGFGGHVRLVRGWIR